MSCMYVGGYGIGEWGMKGNGDGYGDEGKWV